MALSRARPGLQGDTAPLAGLLMACTNACSLSSVILCTRAWHQQWQQQQQPTSNRPPDVVCATPCPLLLPGLFIQVCCEVDTQEILWSTFGTPLCGTNTARGGNMDTDHAARSIHTGAHTRCQLCGQKWHGAADRLSDNTNPSCSVCPRYCRQWSLVVAAAAAAALAPLRLMCSATWAKA